MRRGFTLIQLLVAIAVIGFFLAVLLPTLSTKCDSCDSAQQRSPDPVRFYDQAKVDIAIVEACFHGEDVPPEVCELFLTDPVRVGVAAKHFGVEERLIRAICYQYSFDEQVQTDILMVEARLNGEDVPPEVWGPFISDLARVDTVVGLMGINRQTIGLVKGTD